jgi:hypothetical protein
MPRRAIPQLKQRPAASLSSNTRLARALLGSAAPEGLPCPRSTVLCVEACCTPPAARSPATISSAAAASPSFRTAPCAAVTLRAPHQMPHCRVGALVFLHTYMHACMENFACPCKCQLIPGSCPVTPSVVCTPGRNTLSEAYHLQWRCPALPHQHAGELADLVVMLHPPHLLCSGVVDAFLASHSQSPDLVAAQVGPTSCAVHAVKCSCCRGILLAAASMNGTFVSTWCVHSCWPCQQLNRQAAGIHVCCPHVVLYPAHACCCGASPHT